MCRGLQVIHPGKKHFQHACVLGVFVDELL
jgi:hypothetical protein